MTDTIICFVFIGDFAVQLIRSKDRLVYLRWGWIDLISSIPMVDAFRVGRMVRLIRILRLLRGVRSTRVIAAYVFRNRTRGTLATVSLLSLLMMFFAAIAILNVETVPEANIKSAGDAMWWSFVTITTVGYGDRYPVTLEGRLIAGILMIVGVGLFGTFTGCVASWFMAAKAEEEKSDLEALRLEVAELKRVIEEKIVARE
jgi:voltage-gated potassium channel